MIHQATHMSFDAAMEFADLEQRNQVLEEMLQHHMLEEQRRLGHTTPTRISHPQTRGQAGSSTDAPPADPPSSPPQENEVEVLEGPVV